MKTKACILGRGMMLVSALTGCGGGYGTGITLTLPAIPTPAPTLIPSPTMTPVPTQLGFEGIWFAPAYGKVQELIETENDIFHIKSYLVTNTSCLIDFDFNGIPLETLQQLGVLSDDKNQFEEKSNGVDILPGIVYKRSEALPESCQQHNYPLKGEDDYQFNPDRDFEIFWHTLHELYLDFNLSDTDWNEIYLQSKPKVASIETEEQLFTLFSEMIVPLSNGHNFINWNDQENGGDEKFFSVALKPSLEDLLSAEYIKENSLEQPLSQEALDKLEVYIQQQQDIIADSILRFAETPEDIVIAADGNIGWFKTADNIGYIFLHSMQEYKGEDSTFIDDLSLANELIDAALLDLQGVKGLIVDIRLNEGGYDELSTIYASRFLAGRTHLYSKQARFGHSRTPLIDVVIEPSDGLRYLGPVVVLTSASTGSAAEVFAMAMRALPSVTMIGESTAGAFSDVLFHRVTSDIFFGFSNEYYLSTTGEWFEQEGVPVDIEVPFATKEQRQLSIDKGLQKAIEILLY